MHPNRLRPMHPCFAPVGRSFLTCLRFPPLARFGKPSNYSRSAFQAERAKHRILKRKPLSNVHLKNRLRPMRPCFAPVGRCFLTCLRLPSLARFGKPSNYSRSAFQAERAKRAILRRKPSSNVHLKNRLRPMHPGFAPVGRCFLTCLRLPSLARFGKPSNYSRSAFQAERAKRAIHRRKPSSNVHLKNRLRPMHLCFAPLADTFLPVCVCLRSLGLENRATIVARLSKPRERSAESSGGNHHPMCT